MSADKNPFIFSCQIEAVVYLYGSPSFFGIVGRFKVLAIFNSYL